MSLLPVVPESLYDIVVVDDPQLSPDGQLVAFVRTQPDAHTNGYHRAIWLAPVDGSAPPRPITGGRGQAYAPRWSPDGSALVFVSTRSGSAQLYVASLLGGEARQLTNALSGVSNPGWSPDGNHIAYNALTTADERALEDDQVAYAPAVRDLVRAWSETHRESLRDPRLIAKLPYRTGTSFFDGRYQHVYVVPSEGGAPCRLSDGDYHHSAPDWSADSRFVVTNSNREQSSGEETFELWSSILRYDLQTGETVTIGHEVSEEGRPVRVSPDGRWVAFTYAAKIASPYQDQYHVAIMPIDGGRLTVLTAESEVSVADFAWDADSEHLLLIIHERGDAKLARIACTGGQPETLLDGQRWIQQISVGQDGRQVVFLASTPTQPGEIFAVDLASGSERQVTHFNKEWVASHALSAPQELWYKGADDVDIQGWFLRPRDFDPSASYPLAVLIHGGPQAMYGNRFSHDFQLLTSQGYYVFYCNPRGSSGYGREFQLIREGGGDTDAPDIITGMEQVLASEPAADAERLVVTGGSYGGQLTAWVVGHYHCFKAAVAQAGVYDHFNMYGSSDIPECVEWYYNGIPRVENLQELWAYSPGAYAKDVTTPTMLLHSELDYRVPISQAETFFAHLRRWGNRDAVMLRYPREGHGLSVMGEPHHRIDRLRQILSWFERHVQSEPLGPESLAAAGVRSALATLPGWEFSDGALVREINCGVFGVGLALVNRLAQFAKTAGYVPTLELSATTVIVRLHDPVAHGVTEREVAFARQLSQRMLPG